MLTEIRLDYFRVDVTLFSLSKIVNKFEWKKNRNNLIFTINIYLRVIVKFEIERKIPSWYTAVNHRWRVMLWNWIFFFTGFIESRFSYWVLIVIFIHFDIEFFKPFERFYSFIALCYTYFSI